MTHEPTLHLVLRPHALPPAPASGRAVVLDLAFAFGRSFETVTRPFIRALGQRLALWVDHHDHDAWRDFDAQQNFVLVSKLQARACPQLIVPERVAAAGKVDHVIAHGDFDGAMAAAKFLRGGHPPYADADEDARFSDAPGHGFSCSAGGLRIIKAFDQAQACLPEQAYAILVAQVVATWTKGSHNAALEAQIDSLVAAYRERTAKLDALLARAVAPVQDALLLQVPAKTAGADKKYLLRAMEERATIAMIWDGAQLTVATYEDEGETGLDLSVLRGLRGQRGYAWGKVSPEKVLPQIAAALRARTQP